MTDVVIYLPGLCEILGINLESEIIRKVEINRNRRYAPEGDAWTKTTQP